MEQNAFATHLSYVSGYKTRRHVMESSRERAFVAAVQATSHQMYRIAMGLLHAPQDAEDAVSSAVEATWKQLWRIRKEEALPAYLIRSTANAAKMELRRRRRTESMEPYADSLAAEDSGNPITDYLSALKKEDQLLMILKYQENMPEAEIALILRIPRGTVSSRLSRLLSRLRAELAQEECENA